MQLVNEGITRLGLKREGTRKVETAVLLEVGEKVTLQRRVMLLRQVIQVRKANPMTTVRSAMTLLHSTT